VTLYIDLKNPRDVATNSSFRASPEFVASPDYYKGFTAYTPKADLGKLVKVLTIIANENLSARDCEVMAIATLREVVEGE